MLKHVNRIIKYTVYNGSIRIKQQNMYIQKMKQKDTAKQLYMRMYWIDKQDIDIRYFINENHFELTEFSQAFLTA